MIPSEAGFDPKEVERIAALWHDNERRSDYYIARLDYESDFVLPVLRDEPTPPGPRGSNAKAVAKRRRANRAARAARRRAAK